MFLITPDSDIETQSGVGEPRCDEDGVGNRFRRCQDMKYALGEIRALGCDRGLSPGVAQLGSCVPSLGWINDIE